MKTLLLSLASILSAEEPPAISDKAQAAYWKSLAIHNELDARLKGSLSAEQRGMMEAMDKQAADVNAATTQMSGECGAKLTLDREQFKHGSFVCVALAK